MCGLQEYADAVVGTLNVEYRKRTTIAVELAAKVGVFNTLFAQFNQTLSPTAKAFALPRRAHFRFGFAERVGHRFVPAQPG